MIRRTVGPEPDGASLGTKMHNHDFGPYLTVVCRYDADDKVAADYAFACDSQLPPEWDDVARRELSLVT